MSNQDTDSELLTHIYNAFDPFQPLLPGNPAYVDCRAVRGDGDIRVDLGNRITRSQQMTYQLYSGHRGAGKSTELLRLKQDLESKGFFVVYFAADEQDVNREDTQYTDILLACTRHLLEDLKATANPQPLLDWLRSRWQELKDLALMEVSFDTLQVDAQIALFAKLTANIRAEPTQRHQIRERIDPYTTTLIDALNQFIDNAKRQLPDGKTQLTVIADNLDRIVPIPQENGRSNHEEIFLDRSEQLKALNCHLIYTVPVSMVYSKWANDLKDNYGNPQVLPMIMVRTQAGQIYPEGLSKIKEVIARRVKQLAPDQELETAIFDAPETLERLCLMSGGHVRELLLLAQEAVNRTEALPISARAVQRAITEARDVYRRTVEEDQWAILARVAQSKTIQNDNQHRSLLFNRCLLEYRYLDAEGEKHTWYDVHPLIKDIEQFQRATSKLKP